MLVLLVLALLRSVGTTSPAELREQQSQIPSEPAAVWVIMMGCGSNPNPAFFGSLLVSFICVVAFVLVLNL